MRYRTIRLTASTIGKWVWCDMGHFEVKTNKAQWRLAVHNGCVKAAKVLAEQMHSDSLSFVPKEEGTLRDSFRMEETGDGADLVWNTPYALYQWYGCWPDGSHVVSNHTTPGASTAWVDKAKQKCSDTWRKVAENALKEGIG